jgi:hypothetical protein
MDLRKGDTQMFTVYELGEINGERETHVYMVRGPEDCKSATVRSAVQSAQQLGEVITMGDVIVEPTYGPAREDFHAD